MDESFDPLKCNEDLLSSPGCHMDYGKILKSHNTLDPTFMKSLFFPHFDCNCHQSPLPRWHARLTGGGGGPEVSGSISGRSRSVSPGVQPLPKHQLARWTCWHRHESWEPPAEKCPPQEVSHTYRWCLTCAGERRTLRDTTGAFVFVMHCATLMNWLCAGKYPQQLWILFCIHWCKWLKLLPHTSRANLSSTSCSPKRHPPVTSLFNHHQYQADVRHSLVRHYWLNQSVIRIVACKFPLTYNATNSFSCAYDHCFLCLQIISSPHIWQQ